MAAKSRTARRKPATRTGATAVRRPARARKAGLALRRKPLQTRGQETFGHILDATARLLDEAGIDGVNTNAIARAAGINIATLYQYFPNKQAVLLALFERHLGRRADTGKTLLAGIARSRNWPQRIDAMVDGMAQLRESLPGTAVLVQAMRADPELRKHQDRLMQQFAEELSGELLQLRGMSRAQAVLVSRCVIEVNVALIDLWHIGSGGKDGRILDELKQLHRAYLGRYLPVPARSPARRRRSGRRQA